MKKLISFLIVTFVFISCSPRRKAGDAAAGLVADESAYVTADLESLELFVGTLKPSFDPNITEYTVHLGISRGSINVIPTTKDTNANITVSDLPVKSGEASDPLTMNLGENNIKIAVKTDDESIEKMYRIKVTRRELTGQQAYLKASDAETDDRFGHSVAMSGDTIVVGAPHMDGFDSAVYVFIRNEDGTWSQQTTLTESGSDICRFGESVAISGDTIIVGAPFKDNFTGAAYVFVRDENGVWSQPTTLAGSGSNNCRFGSSVAISEDTIVVGAPYKDSYAGAAYVFVRNEDGVWSQPTSLAPVGVESGDGFGGSIAVSGDAIVVGAMGEDGINNDVFNSGAAYVFIRDGDTWPQQVYLKASNAEVLDWFGKSVAISGDTIIVGAPSKDSNDGAAYVFVRDGNTWPQQTSLEALNAGSGGYFGGSVTILGDAIVVGAPYKDSYAGAAYVFVRSGNVWSQPIYLNKASNAEAFDYFGAGVAISGDTIVVGAFGEDSNATGINGDESNNEASNSGAAYVFY